MNTTTHAPARTKHVPCGCLTDGHNWLNECEHHRKIRKHRRAVSEANNNNAAKLAEALRELLFVSRQSMIVPNAYCEGCDASSDGRKIVHKQGCIFVRAPATLAEWDAS